MKIKRIKNKENIHPGEYFETIQNQSPIETQIENCSYRYYFISTPSKLSLKTYYQYIFKIEKWHKDSYLNDYFWILGKYIWRSGDISKVTVFSLKDMGITDSPHNNHKLYKIIEGEWEDVKQLTIEQLESLVEN